MAIDEDLLAKARAAFDAALDEYLEEWTATLRKKMERDHSDSFAEADDTPDELLEVPDVMQQDSFGCGAACSMSVARYFGVGPTEFATWEKLLGSDPDKGTPPTAIVHLLRSLGLRAEARQLMTIDDLRDCWRAGRPVICPIQDYDPDAGPGEWEGGHYVVYIGGPALGYVFVQDPMADVELEGASSDAAPGRVMIRTQRFLDVWHDRSAEGGYFLRFGIIVGR